jgi:nuclear pore complex protein Nup85
MLPVLLPLAAGLTDPQVAAQIFVEDKDFGLAVSYCASAEDWPGLGRVVDRVLEEYITNGLSTHLHTFL